MQRLCLLSLVIILSVMFLCGASCVQRGIAPNSPVVFVGTPSIQDVIRVVNENSSRVHRMRMMDATLSGPNFPDLGADVAWERPGRFRLVARSFRGTELDLGSNDELFWIWIVGEQPPALYYARHDAFSSSTTQAALPVSPQWIVDALGLIKLNPVEFHEGPIRRQDGQLQIRSQLYMAGRQISRVSVIDAARGWVIQQHLLDSQGQLLASATASEYRYHVNPGVNLPHRIDVSFPATGLSFGLRIGGFELNSPLNSANPWQMPNPQGVDYVDLTTRPAALPTARRMSGQHREGAEYTANRDWLDRVHGIGRGGVR